MPMFFLLHFLPAARLRNESSIIAARYSSAMCTDPLCQLCSRQEIIGTRRAAPARLCADRRMRCGTPLIACHMVSTCARSINQCVVQSENTEVNKGERRLCGKRRDLQLSVQRNTTTKIISLSLYETVAAKRYDF